jgi:hypothetical protein
MTILNETTPIDEWRRAKAALLGAKPTKPSHFEVQP